jgi:hypothetical protein
LRGWLNPSSWILQYEKSTVVLVDAGGLENWRRKEDLERDAVVGFLELLR